MPGRVREKVAVFILTTSLIEKHSRDGAPKRQRAQENLVEKVLEMVQGMSVVKSFNLDGKTERKVDTAIEESYRNNSAIEKKMTPVTFAQQIILNLFSVLIMGASVLLYLNGQISLVKALTLMVYSFMVFEQLKSAGSNITNLRITEASIDKANEIDQVPVMDEAGSSVHTEQKDICFRDVNFSYDTRPILKNVSFNIPEKTTTAIIGPSGSGKSTLCSLIARFWDVEEGQVTIGGIDVREYKLDRLMRNISMGPRRRAAMILSRNFRTDMIRCSKKAVLHFPAVKSSASVLPGRC